MKHPYLFAACLTLCTGVAVAVDFNKDALKAMQQEGLDIVDQEKGFRAFSLSSNLCLHAAKIDKPGANLQVQKCKPKSDNQKWQFDDQNRLTTKGGVCLGVGGKVKEPGAKAQLQKCGGAKHQRWKLDGQGRLVNGLDKCLQASAKGNAGASLETRPCDKSAAQTWQ